MQTFWPTAQGVGSFELELHASARRQASGRSRRTIENLQRETLRRSAAG
jgi:hypothetical protein